MIVPAPSSAPLGKSRSERSRAVPMSIVQVSGPVMRGLISPAAVRIEKLSSSTQPFRRR